MKFTDFFALVFSVLKDWHVIVTLVVMLFVMWAVNFILKYKKKPRVKKAKTPAPAEAPKPEEPKAEEQKEGE